MSPTDLTHLHLLLNHVPTIGTVIGLGLFLLSLVRRHDHLRHASFEVFFVVALLTLPAYLTGVAAQEAIAGREGVTAAAMQLHHDAALLAFGAMEITGMAAWIALWQFRRVGRPAGWASPAVLALSVVTVALMGRAAALGGEIRHPEILRDAGAAVPDAWLAASVGEFVSEHPWVWPAAETLHFIGLCLLLGILLVVNLRLLGVIRGVPFEAVHRLLPWGMVGFGLNLVTGMLFFVTASGQYIANGPFHWKVAFMLLAGANLLYLTVFDKIWALARGDEAALVDKAIAASALGLWAGVIYMGRMLPFLGNAF